MHYIGYGIGWFLYCELCSTPLHRLHSAATLLSEEKPDGMQQFRSGFYPLSAAAVQVHHHIENTLLLVIGVVGPRLSSILRLIEI